MKKHLSLFTLSIAISTIVVVSLGGQFAGHAHAQSTSASLSGWTWSWKYWMGKCKFYTTKCWRRRTLWLDCRWFRKYHWIYMVVEYRLDSIWWSFKLSEQWITPSQNANVNFKWCCNWLG